MCVFLSFIVNYKLCMNINIWSGTAGVVFHWFLSAKSGKNLIINLWYSMLRGLKSHTDVTQWICAWQILELTQGAIRHTSASLLMVRIWCHFNFLNSLWPSNVIWWRRSESTFSWWFGTWWHQAITWTNVDLSPVRSSDINLRAISH